MINVKQKILCFEYMIYSLLLWYKELSSDTNPISSFTRLKSLKLLFLVSAVDATQDNDGLLDIFDKFYAMQHGPVESDIYNAMVMSETSMFDFKERITIIKNPDDNIFAQIPAELRVRIDLSIKVLRDKNESIVLYNSFDLVEITHKWESWQIALDIAQILVKRSELMSVSSIRNDSKYFR